MAGEHTNQFAFEKGVRQGCVLSPMLISTCGEKIMRMVESHWSKISLEFKISGRHDPDPVMNYNNRFQQLKTKVHSLG